MLYSHVIPLLCKQKHYTVPIDKKLIHSTEKLASQDSLELIISFITSSHN